SSAASDVYKRQRQLDGFAAAWSEASTALCTAGDVDHELTAVRRRCLERQRDALDAVSGAFSDAPDFDLTQASNLASALPRPETCSELNDIDAPEGTEVQLLIDAQQRLARAQALHRAGLSRDGVKLATRVLSDLEGAYAPRLKAKAHLWKAARLRFSDRYDEALVETRAAQVDAAHSGDDDLQVLGWLDRAYHTQSATPEEHTLQDAQLEAAELALLRAGDPPELRIRYLMRKASSLSARGAPRDAIATIDQTLALAQTHPPRAMILSNIYNLRAIGFIRVDDRLRAQADFQRAHDTLENAYGPYHPTLSQSRNNLGHVCLELGDLECARSTLETSQRILEAALEPNLPSTAVVLGLLSTVAFRQDRFDEAQRYARASLATVAQGNLGGTAIVLTSSELLLRVLSHRKDWDAGEAEVQRLLAWNEQHHTGTARSAEALLLAAQFDENRGEYIPALEFVQRARSILQRHLEPPHADLVDVWRIEANLHRGLGHLEKAESALALAEDMISGLEDASQYDRAQLQLSRIQLLGTTDQVLRASELALELLRTFDDPQPAATELRERLTKWMRKHDVAVPKNPAAIPVAPLSPG
ncbi:MAG: tetratricopeptide repeat protein, partial [Nannocystaceae bacterium]|nr:tetratricopeptide repeat protein [Nannocystaceae bacterium]